MTQLHLADVFEIGLDSNAANYAALTPLTFIERAAAVYPDHVALSYGAVRRTWGRTFGRCRQLASALARRGIGKGDTVAVEAHFGVPMVGGGLERAQHPARLRGAGLHASARRGEGGASRS